MKRYVRPLTSHCTLLLAAFYPLLPKLLPGLLYSGTQANPIDGLQKRIWGKFACQERKHMKIFVVDLSKLVGCPNREKPHAAKAE